MFVLQPGSPLATLRICVRSLFVAGEWIWLKEAPEILDHLERLRVRLKC